MSSEYATLQPGFPRMTEIAVFHRPCDLTIVAHATEAAVDNVGHSDVVRSHAHLKTQLVMANLAAKANPVKPVRKYDGTHTLLLGITIQDDVSVFRTGHRRHRQGCEE